MDQTIASILDQCEALSAQPPHMASLIYVPISYSYVAFGHEDASAGKAAGNGNLLFVPGHMHNFGEQHPGTTTFFPRLVQLPPALIGSIRVTGSAYGTGPDEPITPINLHISMEKALLHPDALYSVTIQADGSASSFRTQVNGTLLPILFNASDAENNAIVTLRLGTPFKRLRLGVPFKATEPTIF